MNKYLLILLFAVPLMAVDPYLIANWSMEDLSATGTSDESGNGNHLYKATGATIPDKVTGKIGLWAANTTWRSNNGLSAADKILTIKSTQVDLSKTTGNFSISLWVNISECGEQGNTYVGKPQDATHVGFIHGERGDTIPPFTQNCAASMSFTNADCTSQAYAQGEVNMSKNVWHYVVGVFNGTNVNVYVDGVLNATQSHGALCSTPSVLNTSVGCWRYDGTNCGTINGYAEARLDEILIYNRSMDAPEIAAVWAEIEGGSGGSTSNHTPSWNDAQTLWNTGIGELFGTNLLIIGAFFLLFAVFISQRMGLPAEVAIPFGIVFIFILTIVNPGLLPGMAWTGLLVLMAFMLFFALRNVFRSA